MPMNSPFFHTPAQRVALARQRFFEQGQRPTGLVSEAVIQSWARCVQQRQEPARAPAFNPVSASRVHSVLQRNRVLLQAASAELAALQHTLAGTSTAALLLDPQGVVMHASWAPGGVDTPVLDVGARVGVNLAEDSIGTNAPGITARTGHASVVLGEEHFASITQRMHCAAAPVRDSQGRLAAVLDLSSEGRPFAFDAAGLVALYATAIENRLLRAQAHDQLLVQLQVNPALLHTPMAGLLGVDSRGQVVWLNPAAAALLGRASAWPAPTGLGVEAALGQHLAVLQTWTQATPSPRTLRLPSGLTVWVSCQWADGKAGLHDVPTTGPITTEPTTAGPTAPRPADGARAAAPAPTLDDVPRPAATAPRAAPAMPWATASAQPGGAVLPAAAEPQARPQGTLRDNDRRLIEQTLVACRGNVSQAARRLGVSRGLIYRHLQAGPAGG